MRPFMEDVFEYLEERDACQLITIKVKIKDEEANSSVPVRIEIDRVVNIPIIQTESDEYLVPLEVFY